MAVGIGVEVCQKLGKKNDGGKMVVVFGVEEDRALPCDLMESLKAVAFEFIEVSLAEGLIECGGAGGNASPVVSVSFSPGLLSSAVILRIKEGLELDMDMDNEGFSRKVAFVVLAVIPISVPFETPGTNWKVSNG